MLKREDTPAPPETASHRAEGPTGLTRRAVMTAGVAAGLTTGLATGCQPAVASTASRPSRPHPTSRSQENAMMMLRPAADRFHTRIGWLDSWHSFSFGEHYHPEHMGFRSLRVINEDRVTAGSGFGTHPHQDMEIISYVVDGALSHKDSMGNGSTIVPGDVQRMSAGTGVYHSERNERRDGTTHFLQIWLLPKERGMAPSYAQACYPDDDKRDRLRLVASDTPKDGAIEVHADVDLYASLLTRGTAVTHTLARGGHGWLQLVKGALTVRFDGDTIEVGAGDGLALRGSGPVELVASDDTELLLFDLG